MIDNEFYASEGTDASIFIQIELGDKLYIQIASYDTSGITLSREDAVRLVQFLIPRISPEHS